MAAGASGEEAEVRAASGRRLAHPAEPLFNFLGVANRENSNSHGQLSR